MSAIIPEITYYKIKVELDAARFVPSRINYDASNIPRHRLSQSLFLNYARKVGGLRNSSGASERDE